MHFVLVSLVCIASQAGAGDWVSLFDGRTLDGWRGDPTIWSVENGEIVGRTTPGNARTTYLHRDGVFDDFELEFEIKLEGEGANSGMQYRSTPRGPDVGDGFDLTGYQADFDAAHAYSGILYETGGRGIAATRGEAKRFMVDKSTRDLDTPTPDAELRPKLHDGWHTFRIVANGERLEHWINGTRMLLVEDASPTRSESGIFALQVHQGPPMTVRVRNVRLRPLGDGGIQLEPDVAIGREPEWIWPNENAVGGETCALVRTFTIDKPATVSVVATCDNFFSFFIDGTKVLEGIDWGRTWHASGDQLQPGKHTLKAECVNEGGPAGFIAMVILSFEDGTSERIVTDRSWAAERVDDMVFLRPAPVHSFGTVSKHSGPWGNVMQAKKAAGTHTWSLPDGFRSELLVSAQPGDGSWVSCCFDPEGRLVVCPQYGPLQVISFDAAGAVASVRPLPDTSGEPLGYAQGLLHAHDSLWVNIARNGDQGGGLWRLEDTDGDDVYDTRQRVGEYGNGSEHGCHGVALAHDGSIWVVNGNHTDPPEGVLKDSPFRGWHEDQLLEREWDPNGHAVGISMPAGCVHRYDPTNGEWTTLAGGFRNPYDLAFSPAGECLVYDADMEWDIGAPWYIPPLVQHVVPGGDYGWRGGDGKVPLWAPDRMQAVCETDTSSPTGVEFAWNSHFPEPWRSRLFIGDWSYGRVFAIDLVPVGATYTGTVHEFARGTPLNVTDFVFGPDGALYLLTGGRRTQSGLYRIAAEDPVEINSGTQLAVLEARTGEARRIRKSIADGSEVNWEILIDSLSSDDPARRLAARNFLRVEDSGRILGFVQRAPLDAAAELLLAAALEGESIDQMLDDWMEVFENVNDVRKRELMRVLAISIARSGKPGDESRMRLIELLDPMFPTDVFDTDWQLLQLLVALEAPDLPGRALDLIQSDPDPAHQLAFVMSIRTHSADWDEESLAGMFEWCDYASELHGGHSLVGFIAAAREDLARSVDPELLVGQQVWEGSSSATIPVDPEKELGRMPDMVREWTVSELVPLLSGLDQKRDLARGARVFRGTLCIQCHRFAGDGGSTGPDLTGVAGRYSREDMLRTLIEPSHSISDQYEQSAVLLREGGRVVGRVVGMTDSELKVNTNPFGRSIVTIPRAQIDRVEPLETSAMPDHLLDVLLAEEILDMMAYLESGRATTSE